MRARHINQDKDGKIKFLAYMDTFQNHHLDLELHIFNQDEETKEELLKFFKKFIEYDKIVDKKQ